MKYLLIFLTTAIVQAQAGATELIGHPVRVDEQGKLLSWVTDSNPYHHVVTLAWNAFKSIPVASNGLKPYFVYPRFEGTGEHPFNGIMWAHNPAGLTAMITDSALDYFAYSGDYEVTGLARDMLNYQLEHGTTPLNYAWGGVPYSSSTGGALEFRGADDRLFCGEQGACGRGDGPGMLEPDKIGELGRQYLRFYEFSLEPKYLEAALNCANALALNIRRPGDAMHSPWPFRVDAESNSVVREEYTANVLGPVQLFDELIRQQLGDVTAYRKARSAAWHWLLKYPMQNKNWSQYFEDIPIHKDPAENPNQYVAAETARYILEHPDSDPHWQKDVHGILEWLAEVFAADADPEIERGHQYGAEVISEQKFEDMAKMGSHTARYAALNALWYSITGDAAAKEKAFRSFNWATYVCNARGIVKVGTSPVEGYWYSDGYGDYMRHFLRGFAAIPEWAPGDRVHLLATNSLITKISYAPDQVRYRTYNKDSVELLRLPSAPRQVFAGEQKLLRRAHLDGEGYMLREVPADGYILKVLHRNSAVISILL